MSDQFVIDVFLLMLVISAFCSILITGSAMVFLFHYLRKKLKTGRNSDPYTMKRG